MALIDGPPTWELGDPDWWFDRRNLENDPLLQYFVEHYDIRHPAMPLADLVGRSYRILICTQCGEVHRWFVFQKRTLWRHGCKCSSPNQTFRAFRERLTTLRNYFKANPRLMDLLLGFGIDAVEANGGEREDVLGPADSEQLIY